MSLSVWPITQAQTLVWDDDTLSDARMLQPVIDTDTLNVEIGGPLAVTGTFWPATQPVSAASLPLPTDAATATLQGTGNTSLGTIAGKDFATSAKQDTGNTSLGTIAGKDFSTSAKQDTGNTSLGTIAGKDFATQTTLALVATAAKQDSLLAELQLKADLTETQPVSYAALLTELQLKADLTETQPVSGPATDGQLRATPLPISGAVTYAALLTELQLKADLTETQPISVASLPTHGVTGTFWQSTQPVSLASAPSTPVTGTFWQATQPISGTVTATGAKPATSAFTTASVLVTSTTVLASNANRMGATMFNESGAICYLKLGATASLTSYTVQIPIGGSYEVPFGFTGVIDGITVAITAVVRVTELTA